MSLHGLDAGLARELVETALARLGADPPELGGGAGALPGGAITAGGLGGDLAAALLRDAVLPATIAIDHPRYLAFIPSAPTPAAALADLVVSAFAVYGGSWLEGAGAVRAENEALAWLAGLAGFPDGAGGCFVQGGTNGNLSALHAAREQARHAGRRAARVACSDEAHSSVRSMLRVMDAGTLEVPGPRLTGEALRSALDGADDVFAVVATAGTTNLGQVDDLAGVAAVCRERGLWLHVDGAYGLGALCAPSVRARFAGIEHADSFIVDPHKWLFAPFDCCALVYRDPALGRAAHRQHASYLDALSAVTRAGAGEIGSRPELELLAEPDLSVLGFRRRGWGPEDYARWAAALLASGTAFVLPTTVAGETVARLALVNPRTTLDDIRVVLDAMRA